MKPECPLLTVDAIIIYQNKIVCIRRMNNPYKDMFALPGGFVEVGETVESATIREAKEETGLEIELIKLLGVYSDPSRDPRGHVVSICYLAKGSGELNAGSDAKEIELFERMNTPALAFDHNRIIYLNQAYLKGVLA